MTATPEALARAYAAGLRDYARGGGEAALLRAYQAGRDTLTEGLGVLELAAFHQRALVEMLGDLALSEHARAARSAAEFFAEALAPFEMSQRDLRGRVEEHERLERLKNEFLSVVSHELRTPITSIHGSLNLAVEGVFGELPDDARRFLDIAYQNSRRVVRLLDELLDVERMETPETAADGQPLELAPLLASAVEANQAYAARFDARIALAEVPRVKVLADPDRLLQVLTNLLSNAARFSPPGEAVILRAERRAGRVRVSVSDHGPGIPEDFRARVFERFAQAHTGPSGRREGAGLGLSISKAIVERLGGRIGFETELGRGTTFHFELPEWNEEITEDGEVRPWPSRS